MQGKSVIEIANGFIEEIEGFVKNEVKQFARKDIAERENEKDIEGEVAGGKEEEEKTGSGIKTGTKTTGTINREAEGDKYPLDENLAWFKVYYGNNSSDVMKETEESEKSSKNTLNQTDSCFYYWNNVTQIVSKHLPAPLKDKVVLVQDQDSHHHQVHLNHEPDKSLPISNTHVGSEKRKSFFDEEDAKQTEKIAKIDNSGHNEPLSTPRSRLSELQKEQLNSMSSILPAKLNSLGYSIGNFDTFSIRCIEMETRLKELQNGVIDAHYVINFLLEFSKELKNYESSVTPEGWNLKWNLLEKRYYYENAATGAISFSFPENAIIPVASAVAPVDIALSASERPQSPSPQAHSSPPPPPPPSPPPPPPSNSITTAAPILYSNTSITPVSEKSLPPTQIVNSNKGSAIITSSASSRKAAQLISKWSSSKR